MSVPSGKEQTSGVVSVPYEKERTTDTDRDSHLAPHTCSTVAGPRPAFRPAYATHYLPGSIQAHLWHVQRQAPGWYAPDEIIGVLARVYYLSFPLTKEKYGKYIVLICHISCPSHEGGPYRGNAASQHRSWNAEAQHASFAGESVSVIVLQDQLRQDATLQRSQSSVAPAQHSHQAGRVQHVPSVHGVPGLH